MKHRLFERIIRRLSFTACLGGAFATVIPATRAASIPEPPTLVYGRVVHVAGGREFLASEGQLQWTLRAVGEETSETVLVAELAPIADGQYSYQMQIPHEAKVLDAALSPSVVPLSTEEMVARIVDVTLDGESASIANWADAFLAFSQQARARAFRIDIIASAELPDTDADGMPDVWEDDVGLDKQTNDAAGDADGDGMTNLTEFQGGSDPREDNRRPSLLNTQFVVYQGAQTGLMLKSLDTDTPPELRTFTVQSVPAGGALLLGVGNDACALEAGSTFTQADVDACKLVFVHVDATVAETQFTVCLCDDTPGNEPCAADIALEVYSPTEQQALTQGWPAEWLQAPPDELDAVFTGTAGLSGVKRTAVLNWVLGKWTGRGVWDASDSQAATQLSVQVEAVVVGSDADDDLTGGDGSDVIAGGPGADTLTGGDGGDIFVISVGSGHDTVADFSLAQGDRVDLCGILNGASADILDYVACTSVPDGVVLSVDRDGDGSGFDDGSLTLLGLDAATADVVRLHAAGHLIVAGLSTPTVVSVGVADGDAVAEETETRSARFTVKRTGVITGALTVSVRLTGTARNGEDYQAVPETVVVPAGVASVVVPIVPNVDYEVEPDETVMLSVLPGDGYTVGAPSTGQISIRDLEEQVTLEVVEPYALLDEGQAGVFMVKRSGMVARATTVWLDVGGSAANGTDVTRLPTRVTFSTWQTAAYIDVVPMQEAVITGNSETVSLSIKDDPAGAYVVGDPGHGTVKLVQNALKAQDENSDGIPDTDDPDFDGLTTARETEIGSDPNVATLLLRKGWNLVTVPRNPIGEQTLQAQLGDEFSGVVWAWDTDHYCDVADACLQPAKGYFIYTFRDLIIDLEETTEGNGASALEKGWNLVGPIRGGQVVTPGGSTLFVYGYADGAYDPVTNLVLRPMNGYWAHAEKALELTLP